MKRMVVALLIVSLNGSMVVGVVGQQSQQNQNQQNQNQQKKYPQPQVLNPSVFRGDQQPTQQSLGDEKWFVVFKDPKLQDLIRAALENNYDVREAVARVEAAEANVGIVRSNQFPTFTGSSDIT